MRLTATSLTVLLCSCVSGQQAWQIEEGVAATAKLYTDSAVLVEHNRVEEVRAAISALDTEQGKASKASAKAFKDAKAERAAVPGAIADAVRDHDKALTAARDARDVIETARLTELAKWQGERKGLVIASNERMGRIETDTDEAQDDVRSIGKGLGQVRNRIDAQERNHALDEKADAVADAEREARVENRLKAMEDNLPAMVVSTVDDRAISIWGWVLSFVVAALALLGGYVKVRKAWK